MDKHFECSLRTSKKGDAKEVTGWGDLPIDQQHRKSNRSKNPVLIRYISASPPSTTELVYQHHLFKLVQASIDMKHSPGDVVSDLQLKIIEVTTANNTKPPANNTKPTAPTQPQPPQQPINNNPFAMSASLPIDNNPHDMPPLTPIHVKQSAMTSHGGQMGALFYDTNQQAAANMPLFMSPVPPLQMLPMHQHPAQQMLNQPNTTMVPRQMLPIQQQPAQPMLNQPNTTMALSTQQHVAAAAVVQQAAVNKTTEASMEQDVTAAAVQQAPGKAAKAPRMEQEADGVSRARQEDISRLAEEALHVEQRSVAEDKQQQDEDAKTAVALSASTADFLAENEAEATESTTESSTATVPKASTNNVGTKSSSEDDDKNESSKDTVASPKLGEVGFKVRKEFNKGWYSGVIIKPDEPLRK